MIKEKKLVIKETGKYGKGVFSNDYIKSGETILIFSGEIIDLKECLRRVAEGRMSNDDGFQFDTEKYIVLKSPAIYFNHSCEPNSGFRNDFELFAIKDIFPGEEITYDYSLTVGSNISKDMWSMSCSCGSEKCRKTLGNILTIDSDSLEFYKMKGAIQNYILKQLQ